MAESVEKTDDVEIQENVSFSDMMLSEKVLAGLSKCNFKKPSPIQLRAIPIGRCGMGNLFFLYKLSHTSRNVIQTLTTFFYFIFHRSDNQIEIWNRKNIGILHNYTREI